MFLQRKCLTRKMTWIRGRRIENVCLSPNSMAAHMFEKCLTWLEYQSEVNQYNTCTLRELYALEVCKWGESPFKSCYKSKWMHEHVYLYNVVFHCTTLIWTKCGWHLTNGVWINEDSLYSDLFIMKYCYRIISHRKSSLARHETNCRLLKKTECTRVIDGHVTDCQKHVLQL